jgi:hypothetical protein
MLWRAGAPRSDLAHVAGVVINDPNQPNNSVSISSRRMTCASINPDPNAKYDSARFSSQCEMLLDGRLLKVLSTRAVSNLGFCEAKLDGQSLPCTIGITLDVERRWAYFDAPATFEPSWYDD